MRALGVVLLLASSTAAAAGEPPAVAGPNRYTVDGFGKLSAAEQAAYLAVRLPLAAVAVYAVGFAVMKFLPPATGFMPSLYVIVASIVLCAILLPPAPPPAKAKPSPARRGPA